MADKVMDVRFDEWHGDKPANGVKRPKHYDGVGIVEDESELVKVLKKILAKRGIRVCFTACDGAKAVELVKGSGSRPRVILMDYRLFNMNGIDTMKEILKFDPEIRFIFLSADTDAEHDALSSGAVEFLRKPASTSTIIAAISRAMS